MSGGNRHDVIQRLPLVDSPPETKGMAGPGASPAGCAPLAWVLDGWTVESALVSFDEREQLTGALT